MNVHNPFTTNSVVLECDFNLYKMAKALNNMENKIHTRALSDVCHVRVTQHGDVTLKYHANTKVVKALKGYNGKYSIHLLMYSLKGMVRMDLCVYLNEEEYKKLEDSIGEINQWIEDIGVPTHKRNVLKMYRWKITFAKKMNRMNMML